MQNSLVVRVWCIHAGTLLTLGRKRGDLIVLWTRGEPERPCPHIRLQHSGELNPQWYIWWPKPTFHWSYMKGNHPLNEAAAHIYRNSLNLKQFVLFRKYLHDRNLELASVMSVGVSYDDWFCTCSSVVIHPWCSWGYMIDKKEWETQNK